MHVHTYEFIYLYVYIHSGLTLTFLQNYIALKLKKFVNTGSTL